MNYDRGPLGGIPDPDRADRMLAAAAAASPHMCAVCGRVLSRILLDDPTDAAAGGWVHTDWDYDEHDHPPVPVELGEVPVRGRCDFCGSEHPTHVLETARIRIAGVRHDGATDTLGGLDESWACCTACQDLIVKNRWNTLLHRCVDLILAHAEAEPDTTTKPISRDALTESMRALHRQIRKHARGLPRRLDA